MAAGCTPKGRDNPHDDQNRPEVRFTAYNLVFESSVEDQDVFLNPQEAAYRAVPGTSGDAESYFLVDAQASRSPRFALSSLSFEWFRVDRQTDNPDDPASLDVDPCPAFENAVLLGPELAAPVDSGAAYVDRENGGALYDPAFSDPCPGIEPVVDEDGDCADCENFDDLPCRVFGPGVVVEGVVVDPAASLRSFERERPLPLCLRVTDPDGGRAVAWVPLHLLNLRPVSVPDVGYVLPLSTDVHSITLGAAGSYDRDYADLDPADPAADGELRLQAHCWQQVEQDPTRCIDPALITVTDITDPAAPEPPDKCPPLGTYDPFPSACADLEGGLLEFDLPGDVRRHTRFRLWVRDTFGWSTPAETSIRVGEAPLWLVDAEGAVRTAPGFRKLDLEGRRAIASVGPATTDWVAVTDSAGIYEIARIDPLGGVVFVPGGSLGTASAVPLAAAHDASSTWASFLRPDGVLVVVADGTGEVARVVFPGHEPIDLLVAAGGGAWGARRGGTGLWRFDRNGAVVEKTFTAGVTFTAVGGLTANPELNGNIYVSDGPAEGSEPPAIEGDGSVVVIQPDGTPGPALPDNLWIRPLGLHYEDTGTPGDTSDDGLFVADDEVYVFPVGIPPADAYWIGFSGIRGDARFFAADDATFALWLLPAASADVTVIDTIAETANPGTFRLDGTANGASAGVLDGRALVSTSVAGGGSNLWTVPHDAADRPARSQPLGILADASTGPYDGGAWLAFEAPPRVYYATSDGVRFEGSGVCDVSLAQPRRIAQDRDEPHVWLLDKTPEAGTAWHFVPHSSFYLQSGEQCLLPDPDGDPATPDYAQAATPALDGEPTRIRAAGVDLSGRPRAWGLTAVMGTAVLSFVEHDGSPDLVTTSIRLGPASGPAVSPEGTAWVARCNPASGGFDAFAPCDCDIPNGDAATCAVGARLAWAGPGDTSLTAWAPSGVDFGECAGGLCSVLPVDLAFDAEAGVLWVVALDYGAGADVGRWRAWRIECSSGGPLDACADVDLDVRGPDVAGWQTGFEIPGSALPTFLAAHSDLLGIDTGTGRAYFLDPIAGEVSILDGSGSTIRRVGVIPATGAIRSAIGR